MSSLNTEKRTENVILMQGMTYGVEIEMTGITRRTAAETTARVLGLPENAVSYIGGCYGKWSVKDRAGRKWLFVSDCSIAAVDSAGHSAYCRGDYSCELNTPALTLDDMPTLQAVIQALREAGGVTGAEYGCGTHIHVGAAGHSIATLKNFINLVYSQEEMFSAALGIDASRRSRWCRPQTENFVGAAKKCKNVAALRDAWYRCYSNGDAEYCVAEHYDGSRYHLLNLHRYFQTEGRRCNTIEIRAFNASLDEDVIKAYVLLVLGINARSLMVKNVRAEKNPIMLAGNQKFAMRTFLTLMGFNGDYFKTTRKILVGNLPGDAAWRYGKSGNEYR